MRLVEGKFSEKEQGTKELYIYSEEILSRANKKRCYLRMLKAIEEERLRLKTVVLTQEEEKVRKEIKKDFEETVARMTVSTLINLNEYRLHRWKELEE